MEVEMEDAGSPSGTGKTTGQRSVGPNFKKKKKIGWERVKEEALWILASTRALPPEKDCPVGTPGRGVESDLGRGRRGRTARGHPRGDARPDAAHDHSVQARPHAAHGRSARRRVRVAALSAPPPRKAPPGPHRRSRAGPPRSWQVPPWPHRGQGSLSLCRARTSASSPAPHSLSVHSGLN